MLGFGEKTAVAAGGLVVGVLAALLVLMGNPANMGFCIACFLRDIAGALGLHSAKAVQYIRPEIIGLVLGSYVAANVKGEFSPRGGSSPMTRFILGMFVMIGCLMFLGCPFRAILRLAGGDLNAVVGLAGFFAGIASGVFFLNRGYSLKRTYRLPAVEGHIMPAVMISLLILLILAPPFIIFSEAGAGPGAKHAGIFLSLGAGIITGIIAQRTRLCMVGGFRDIILFQDYKLISGFAAVLAGALIANLLMTGLDIGIFFKLGFEGQPVAHNDGIWNALGMYLAGLGCILLGGCPLRQLIMAGEGNSDSCAAVMGLIAGAAFAHNFKLASSANGPTEAGQLAVIIGIAVVLAIACKNTFGKEA